MTAQIKKIYDALILKRPYTILLILISILIFCAYHIRDFKLDASADTLLLENDSDLQLFRDVIKRYKIKDFLFVTFTPHEDLFSNSSLSIIKQLRSEFSKLEMTDSVVSLIDVPLVKQLEGSLATLTKNYRTLQSDDVDKKLAKQELLASPIYQDLIISADAKTTALQINLKANPEFSALLERKNELLKKDTLTEQEKSELATILTQYDALKIDLDKNNHQNIVNIRKIMAKYSQYGLLHLGGTSMIADDMISFIKNDLIMFGSGVFIFLILMLSIIFRQFRWVFLPLLSCMFTGVVMLGLLGLIGWRVTVISSNFISLVLIITMSMNIHLVIRYLQLRTDFTEMSHRELVLETASKMVWPCLYTALTTILAFMSLVVSDIKPVIDFGWMMTIGLICTFLTSFLLFPCVLTVLGPSSKPIKQTGGHWQFTTLLAKLSIDHGNKVIGTAMLVLLLSIIGISRLEVENSFANYFHKDTNIYQGLKLIDDTLGGTATLDIVLKFDSEPVADEDDDFDLMFGEVENDPSDYWFTPDKIDEIKKLHDYLGSLPAIGKVLSLASIIRVGEDINKGAFDAFELALVYKRMPENLRAAMIDPYISVENNEARINLRVRDSMENLRRKELINQIRYDLTEKFGFSKDRIKISGLLVLYNNMLQSLFKSQILTLGTVMLGIAIMLLILFRSLPLAIIGIIPNLLAATVILGLMGLFRIPLDMMTITIAAITIGIAVDNSIHYIYRFREEYAIRKDYLATLHYCHANIGRAVFYNAITIISGFSILIFSNFIPTIYFGILTALAMLIALLAGLTLLPKLLLLWRPLQ